MGEWGVKRGLGELMSLEIASMLVTHKKADVEDIESAWHGDVESLLSRLHEHELVDECVVLKTCNRVEVYVVSEKGQKVLYHFAKEMNVPERIIDFLDHEESLRHLFRLSCGLESMIVGEDQILGQMKDLYHIAKETGTTGKTLDTAFNKAIQVGKRARNETGINKGSVSIGSAAVDLAEEITGGLEGKNVLVIGAGDMGTLVARALASKGLEGIYVANRTYERAECLAEELGGTAVRYEELGEALPHADVVISATSAPHHVLHASDIKEALEKRGDEQLLIDIANPRDIDDAVGRLPGARLHNIDSLRQISEENLQKRLEEAKKAEDIIEEELEAVCMEYKRQRADDIIAALYLMAEEIRENEKTKAINKLSHYHTLGETEREVIEDMSHSITYKILSDPTAALREAAEREDEEKIIILEEIFNLNGSKE